MAIPSPSSLPSDVRPTVDANPEAALFQFVTVRAPRMSTNGKPLLGVIAYRQDNSPFVGELITLRNKEATDVAAQLEEIKALTKNHIQSAEFTADKNVLLNNSLPLIRFGLWLREKQAELTNTAVTEAQTNIGARPADEKSLNTAWEALIGDAIVGGASNEREDFMAALRAQYFLEHQTQTGDNMLALQQLAAVEVVLPANLFPLPQLQPVAVIPTASIANNKSAQEQTAKINELNAYNRAISELRNLTEVRMEEARNTPDPVNLTQSGASLPAQESGNKVEVMAEANRSMEFIGDPVALTEETQKIVAGIGSVDKLRTSFMIRQLEQRATQLARAIGQSASVSQQVFEAGGALWMQQLPVESAQNDSDLTTVLKTNFIGSDAYDGFYAKENTHVIRPLGIADLNRVEQSLSCYKAGEIAHIENIMQGEYKERSTRRLQRSEETYDLTTEREQTQERDTTTTDRYELAQETSRVITENNAFTAAASASGTLPFGEVKVEASSNFSTSFSSTESDKQTSSYAKNITDRSLQRIVTRVREQRTTKLIDEYEENNKHGLDNRTGTKHVVGLYRWVDKIYTAQVVNYGKRLMFEFMVPEPGNFHLWAMFSNGSQTNLSLTIPPDPRIVPLAGVLLDSHNVLDTINYGAWAAMYNADVEAPPDKFISVGLSMAGNLENDINASRSQELEVPKGYFATYVSGSADVEYSNDKDPSISVFVGKESFWVHNRGTGANGRGGNFEASILPVTGKVPVSFSSSTSRFYLLSIVVKCELLQSAVENWQIKTFNAILEAYQLKKDAYDKAISEARAQMAAAKNSVNQIQGTNPTINQTIIQNELKKGCINWLFNGQDFSNKNDVVDNRDLANPPKIPTDPATLANLERAKFIEQCFEWSLMTYTFYPYFWAAKPRWRPLYQLTDTDPLFLNFLQSGMARVHVSVRPGYHKAAMHFLSTGEIWNGGDRPGIGSPIYLSIMDELKQPKSTLVGQPWEIRVPTTLTILQAESGVIEGKGLPTGDVPEKALQG